MRLFLSIITAISMVTSLPLLAASKETETFSYELDEGGRISLENVNGDIYISGASGSTVKITADKKADNDKDLKKLMVKIKADNNFIQIETAHEKSGSRWFGSDNSGEVTYTLIVPAYANLDSISTVNGNVTISALAGEVSAESVNGNLDISNLVSDSNLETTNGNIKASFDRMQGSQRVNADTINGQITLILPADTSARLNAETLNGDINASDFGLETDTSGYVGEDLSGDIGEGEARIDLDTLNGSIRVKNKS
jgi:lipopolysaccharide export LptBFGC system permease protein LptF